MNPNINEKPFATMEIINLVKIHLNESNELNDMERKINCINTPNYNKTLVLFEMSANDDCLSNRVTSEHIEKVEKQVSNISDYSDQCVIELSNLKIKLKLQEIKETLNQLEKTHEKFSFKVQKTHDKILRSSKTIINFNFIKEFVIILLKIERFVSAKNDLIKSFENLNISYQRHICMIQKLVDKNCYENESKITGLNEKINDARINMNEKISSFDFSIKNYKIELVPIIANIRKEFICNSEVENLLCSCE